MSINEELECVVCCYKYSFSDRIPRVLHCDHTFCGSCLQKLCKTDGLVSVISCPLCRSTTFSKGNNARLPGNLFVNIKIWDKISSFSRRGDGSLEDLSDTKTHITKLRFSYPPQLTFISKLQRLFSRRLL